MRNLFFIDDDKTEFHGFIKIVRGHYRVTTFHWPSDRAKLFKSKAPDIVVSDLYLPPEKGGKVPTLRQRRKAASAAGDTAARFCGLWTALRGAAVSTARQTVEDDKKRLKETMKTIAGDALRLLRLQWSALGQSPKNGIYLLKKVRTRWPESPFVFYSRKITPEDVIDVLAAGADDAIRKDALPREKVLARLRSALEERRGRG
jgi:DNA-binding response OmpR family regulator